MVLFLPRFLLCNPYSLVLQRSFDSRSKFQRQARCLIFPLTTSQVTPRKSQYPSVTALSHHLPQDQTATFLPVCRYHKLSDSVTKNPLRRVSPPFRFRSLAICTARISEYTFTFLMNSPLPQIDVLSSVRSYPYPPKSSIPTLSHQSVLGLR